MALLTALLVIGIACAIAAWFVVREAGRMAAEPPPPVFDPEEAYEWVVEHVPDIVAATLTPDDVRRILDFQLEYFQRKGVTGNGSSSHPPGDVVVGGAETVDYILERARVTGEEYLPEQVHAVIETQLAYLREIGAVGPAGRRRPPDPPLREHIPACETAAKGSLDPPDLLQIRTGERRWSIRCTINLGLRRCTAVRPSFLDWTTLRNPNRCTTVGAAGNGPTGT